MIHRRQCLLVILNGYWSSDKSDAICRIEWFVFASDSKRIYNVQWNHYFKSQYATTIWSHWASQMVIFIHIWHYHFLYLFGRWFFISFVFLLHTKTFSSFAMTYHDRLNFLFINFSNAKLSFMFRDYWGLELFWIFKLSI